MFLLPLTFDWRLQSSKTPPAGYCFSNTWRSTTRSTVFNGSMFAPSYSFSNGHSRWRYGYRRRPLSPSLPPVPVPADTTPRNSPCRWNCNSSESAVCCAAARTFAASSWLIRDLAERERPKEGFGGRRCHKLKHGSYYAVASGHRRFLWWVCDLNKQETMLVEALTLQVATGYLLHTPFYKQTL